MAKPLATLLKKVSPAVRAKAKTKAKVLSRDFKEIDRYTYRVTWSEDDSEHVGLCTEFPSLSWLDKSPEKALKGIRQLVQDCVSDLLAEKAPVPEPLSTQHYSGKFVVRVPPQVHRLLSIQAAESGVSLNRLVASKLN